VPHENRDVEQEQILLGATEAAQFLTHLLSAGLIVVSHRP
jgi:hypothetical protein